MYDRESTWIGKVIFVKFLFCLESDDTREMHRLSIDLVTNVHLYALIFFFTSSPWVGSHSLSWDVLYPASKLDNPLLSSDRLQGPLPPVARFVGDLVHQSSGQQLWLTPLAGCVSLDIALLI